MPTAKPRKPRRAPRGTTLLVLIDRYLVVVSAAAVAVVWVVGDIVGYTLGEGSKAAMGSFVVYSALKTATDRRWRELEEGEDSGDATPAVAPARSAGKPALKEGQQ